MISIFNIKPNPKNPRKIKAKHLEELKRSIKQFEKMMSIRPIIVDENNMCLAGHQRLKALIELGYEEVQDEWVKKVTNLTEEEKKEFMIKDNVNKGQWDMEALEDDEYWKEEVEEEWLDFAFKKKNEVKDDGYNPPDIKTTDIKEGDIFEIHGSGMHHRVMCGSSTESKDVKALMNGSQCDLVVTDPPYNVNYQGGTDEKLKIQNDNMGNDQFYNFLYDSFVNWQDVTKKGGAWYVWHADIEGLNFRKAMIESGMMMKQCLIWVKNAFVMGRQDYQWKHEPCLYGWKEGASHTFVEDRTKSTVIYDDNLDIDKMKAKDMRDLLHEIYDEFLKSTIINHDKPTRNTEHPTMKPVPLIGELIINSSLEGQIVGDGFGGSGTTMIACHQLNRNAYIMELDPIYVEVEINRIITFDPEVRIICNGKDVTAKFQKT